MKKKNITVITTLVGLGILAITQNIIAGRMVREDFEDKRGKDKSRSKDEICDELNQVYESDLKKKEEELSSHTNSSETKREIRREIYCLTQKLQALPVLRKFMLK